MNKKKLDLIIVYTNRYEPEEIKIKIKILNQKELKKLGINLTQYIDVISDSIVDLEQIQSKYIEFLKTGGMIKWIK